jgi:DUF1680 family protein
MPKKPILEKAPLTDAVFAPLPLKAVRPQGELLKRLKDAARQAGQNAWQDGHLLGYASLALLTNDTALTEMVKGRVEAILADQREDGSPKPGADLAGDALIIRGLIAWYAATADKRVLVYLLKRLQYVFRSAEKLFVDLSSASLTGEYGYAAICLYNWTGKAFLLRLLEKLRALGLDWTGFFHTFPVTRPFTKHIPPEEMKKGLSSPDEQTRAYYEKQQIMADGLALARGLKTPAILSRFSGSSKEKEAGGIGLEKVMHYHGTAQGLFTAEPSLMGGDPSCGMDGRASAEAMFSLEQLLISQGGVRFADALEKIALNILPAMDRSGSMLKYQRVNSPFPMEENTTAAEAGPWADAWLRGMTGYASGLWMAAKDDGLALMNYVPSILRWKIGGTAISIRVEGKYPLDGEVSLTIQAKKPVAFPLHMRIPAWAENASVQVNDEGAQSADTGSFFVLNRIFKDGDKVHISLPIKPRLTRWHHQSAAVEYGPLLMALPVDGEQPLWQLALDQEGAMSSALSGQPGEEKLTVSAVFKKIPGWTANGGRPQMPPIQPETQGEALKLALMPYGETVCRMAQFPLVPEA